MQQPERPTWYDDSWNAFPNVLFVEGKTDAVLMRAWLEAAAGSPDEVPVYVQDVGGGNHMKVRQALEWRLSQELPCCGVVDRDDLTDAEAKKLETRPWSRGRLKVLPRFTIENYLLDPAELWSMLPEHSAVTEEARESYTKAVDAELVRYLHHCSLWKVMVSNKTRLKDLRVSEVVDPVLTSSTPPDMKAIQAILSEYASTLDQAEMLKEYDERHRETEPLSGEAVDLCRLRRLGCHVHGKKVFEKVTQPYLQQTLKLQAEQKGWVFTLSQGIKSVPADLNQFLTMVLRN